MVEINLNDPNNLNPTIQKEEMIKKWNENPEVKKNGIEAIDTKRYNKISKPELNLLQILSVLGIVSLIIIAGSVGYSVYKNGSLIPPLISNQNCEAQTVNIDQGICPTCPSLDCPECINECNFPSTLKVVLQNETD